MDQTNERPNLLEIDKNKIRAVGANAQYFICNHCETLPKVGIYYFKFRILRTATRAIMAGICGKNIKTFIANTAVHSKYYMGYCFNDGNYYANATNTAGTPPMTAIKEDMTFKVEINLN
jgi:hypothetical protein